MAKPLGAPTVDNQGTQYPDPRYQIFTFMLNNAKSSCPADFNHDRVVDGEDLGILVSNWGSTDKFYQLERVAQGLVDIVDGGDLGMLIAAWGACPDATPRRMPAPEDDLVESEADGFRRFAARLAR